MPYTSPYGPTDAVLGRGNVVGYSTNQTAPITYTTLGTLVSMDGPGVTVGEVETPLLANVTKQYAATLPEAEVTFNIRANNQNPAVQALRGMVSVAPVPTLAWQILYIDGYVDTFVGFPKGFTISGVESETVINAAIPVRINGPISTVARTS